jgi:ubiquinone biosynthesis protein
MPTLLFGLLTLPVYLLMLWPLVVASRRVLGVRVRTVRALLGAMVGWVAAGRVLSWLFPNFHTSPGLFAGLIIPIAGCAFLATLMFLFIAEMAFPSGGGLGFVGRLRSIRRRAARARRYSQVSKIAMKHGIGQYLVGRRGTDGTRHAARGAGPVAATGARGWRCHLREAWAGAVNEARPVATHVHR